MNRKKHVPPLSASERRWLLIHEGGGSKSRRHRLKAQAIRLRLRGLRSVRSLRSASRAAVRSAAGSTAGEEPCSRRRLCERVER